MGLRPQGSQGRAAGWGDQSEVVPLGSQRRPPLRAPVQALRPGGAASAHHDPPEPHEEQGGVGRGSQQKRAAHALPQPPHVADPSPCRALTAPLILKSTRLESDFCSFLYRYNR